MERQHWNKKTAIESKVASFLVYIKKVFPSTAANWQMFKKWYKMTGQKCKYMKDKPVKGLRQ